MLSMIWSSTQYAIPDAWSRGASASYSPLTAAIKPAYCESSPNILALSTHNTHLQLQVVNVCINFRLNRHQGGYVFTKFQMASMGSWPAGRKEIRWRRYWTRAVRAKSRAGGEVFFFLQIQRSGMYGGFPDFSTCKEFTRLSAAEPPDRSAMDWKDRWWCSVVGHKSDQPWLGYLESEVETSTEKHLPSYYILKKQNKTDTEWKHWCVQPQKYNKF